jgi:alkanesulfonate monooxygenase SsuD/methylene tetrahydromethanopterin reductase-like flavin-dependent oxidoreductase (luciferase family)
MPDDRLARRMADMREACAAAGRDPATLEMTVGVTVKAESDEGWAGPGAPEAILLEPPVVADALAAYAELGVGHVQLDVQPATKATFERAIAGIAAWRAGRG